MGRGRGTPGRDGSPLIPGGPVAYEVRIIADAVMAGLPWLVIQRGRNTLLCVAERTLDVAPLLTAVLDGSKLLPQQRHSVDGVNARGPARGSDPG